MTRKAGRSNPKPPTPHKKFNNATVVAANKPLKAEHVEEIQWRILALKMALLGGFPCETKRFPTLGEGQRITRYLVIFQIICADLQHRSAFDLSSKAIDRWVKSLERIADRGDTRIRLDACTRGMVIRVLEALVDCLPLLPNGLWYGSRLRWLELAAKFRVPDLVEERNYRY